MKQKGVGELFQNISAQLKARPKAAPAKARPRPTRGKPKLTVVRTAPPPAPPTPPPAAEPAPAAKTRVKVSPEAVLRSRARPAAKERINPFVLANHPPSVFPAGKGTLAMDSAIAESLAWASSALLASSSAFGFQPIYEAGLGFLGYTYLAELSQRAEYRVISETLATESTRKWIKLQATTEDGEDRTDRLKELEDELDRLNVQHVCRTSSQTDGFFGRAHVFVDTGQDDPAELKTPIGDGRSDFSQKKFTKGFLKAFRNVEPVWCYPSNYNASNPLAADFYNPSHWYCQGQELAASRLLTFVGREVPDLLKPAYSFGGLSMSQMVKPTVDNWLRTRQSVSDITHAFSVMVLETDLSQTLAAGGEEFFNRVDFFNATRDNRGLMAVNQGTEKLTNVSAPLGTLDKLQAQAQEHMSSISRIPIVKLLGIQPAGLNASSEGEMQTWDDWVAAYQEMFFGENLRRMIGFAQINLWGAVDPSISFAFEPLRQMTEKERGEIRKNNADTDVAYVNAGVLAPEEVRAAIASDEDSPYATIDVDDVPEPPQQGGEGGEGGDDPDGGGAPPDEESDQAAGEVAEDGVIPFALDAEWSEGDHPRGQPGNAGQFGKGGGGGKKQQIKAPQYGMPNGTFTASGSSSTEPKARKTNIGEPLDTSKLTKVGKQMGSNPGGVFEDGEGKKFYVKQGKTKDHVTNEMTAAALYDLAGTPTLNYRPVKGGTHVATEMAPLDKDNASKLSPAERKEAARDFAVHAWLANWDAVGLGGDNLGTVKGVPTALDLGGALEYRAQGSPKGKAFGEKVGELDTLRDGTNKDAAGIFGGMSPAEMRESARYVTSIPDQVIKQTVKKAGGSEALAAKLIARKNDIAERAKTFGADGDPKKATSTMVVPAGSAPPVKALNGVAFEPFEPPEDWSTVDGQADLDEPAFDAKGRQPASGVIIQEKDGRVWIVQPADAYGGYEGTFPKGRQEEGLSMQANAIKEAYEESGLKVRITGYAGDHAGDVTMTRYYHAERVGGDPSKHDDETEGVVLAPKDKVAGFLNRERDRKIVGADEAPFEESKHPRDEGGKFSSSGGGGGGGSSSEAKETPITESIIGALLSKPAIAGGNYRRTLVKAIAHLKKSGEEGKAKVLTEKLINSWTKTHANAISKGETDKATKIAKKIKELNGGITPSAVAEAQQTAPKKTEQPVQAKAPEPTVAPKFPAPTPQELEKAKKSVALQLQYVPGAPQTPEAQKLVDAFNKKYADKPMSSVPALIQKVQDFKQLQADMVPLMSAQQQAAAKVAAQAAEKQKAAAAAQEAKNQAAAAALKAQQAAAKAKNQEYMKALGISETEASGFDALVDMMSEDSSKADLIEKFKSYQTAAEKLGYPISGFQYALIRNYINGGYTSINKALRSNSPTVAQHVYARLVNNAIDKLPKYTGTVVRGTTLDAQQLAVYKPGHVVQEHGFTSTGVGYKFGGNVHYTIKAHGMRGGDFSTGANKGEKEVLFKAKTQFLVHKVEKKGDTTYIEMEEVEGHG